MYDRLITCIDISIADKCDSSNLGTGNPSPSHNPMFQLKGQYIACFSGEGGGGGGWWGVEEGEPRNSGTD